jgi:hypothetical protein
MSRDALWKERQSKRRVSQWSRDEPPRMCGRSRRVNQTREWSQGNTRKYDFLIANN